MGTFSGEDVYQFEVATAKMVDTDVDPLKDAILTAVLVEEDIPSYLLATLMNSISIKAKKYLEYGKNHYIYGLPTASMAGEQLDRDALADAIATEEGEPVTIVAGWAGTVNIEQHAFEAFQDEYGWRINENIFRPNSYPTRDFRVVGVRQNGDTYNPPTRILVDTKRIIDGFDYIIGMDYPEKDYYYYGIFYLDSETPDDIQYWTYDPELGTYPDLTITVSEEESEYYPIAPIRVDKKWVEDDPEEDDDAVDPWRTTQRLLKRVTLNIPDIREAIEEEQDDDDIENLNDIFSMFAVDVYTECEESIEYLYKFFDKLYGISEVTQAQYELAKGGISITESPPPANDFQVEEEQFKTVLEYNYITKEVITGELGKAYEKVIKYIPQDVYEFEIEYLEPGGDYYYTVTRRFKEQNSTITIRKDNEDGTYTELLMHGPKHISFVRALGKFVKVYRKIDEDWIRDENTEIEDWDKYGQSGFFFPVDFTIMETLSFKRRMYALMDSMLLVIYAAAKEHLEWYETGIFRALLQFVMIVINVVLFLPTLGSSLKLSAVLWKVFLALALPKILNYIFELLVKAFGKDAAVFFIAAMFAFGLFKGLGASLKGLPNALDILDVTKALNKGLSAYGQIQGITQQFELEEMEKQQQELEDAQGLLDQDGYQPWYAIQAMLYTNPEEVPEDFYNRTIHLGNPGVLSLDMIATYCDRALQLPEPGEVGKSIVV